MCLLCSVQRWSRRAAALLPWVVVPMIGVWALSQLFPPPFRIEFNYPRFGCVLVLLFTLCWYELIMPRFIDWSERRAAAQRRRQLARAAELHRLRRAATRRCRNCLAPYRDQRPSGRFTCASCGHVSRRPVLDLPGDPAATSGLFAGWLHSLDDNGHFASLVVKTYAGAVHFAFQLLSCVRWWLGRLVFWSSGRLSDAEHQRSGKKEENEGGCQESRAEKARRKAEEKRQARLEKEMLEEEERKQREEVAKLVEERRKLRDEKLEAEKRQLEKLRRNEQREEERRKRERRERDKGSNKSSSDGEESEKRRGSDRKRDIDKKSEDVKRDSQNSEVTQGTEVVMNKPTKYFDRMKGSFLSSSKGFRGANLFGRSSRASAGPAAKITQSVGGLVDHGQKCDTWNAHSNVKYTKNGIDRNSETKSNSMVGLNVLPRQTAPKKAWHSLFTRSSTVYPCPDSSGTSSINQNGQVEAQTAQLTDKSLLRDNLDNQLSLGQSLPFPVYPSHVDSNSVSHPTSGSIFPPIDEPGRNSIFEEGDVFEDPCYVPDPVSLLGPVSRALDNFPLNLGPDCLANSKVEEPCFQKNVPFSTEMHRPSPIESPMQRFQVPQEKHVPSVSLPDNLMPSHLYSSELDEPSNKHEHGTWQMWGSPLAHDALGFIGGPNLNPSPGLDRSIQGDMFHPLSSNNMMSQLSKENHVLPATLSYQNVHPGIVQNGSPFGPLGSNLINSDPWVQKPSFQSFPVEGKRISNLDLMNDFVQNEITRDQLNKLAVGHHFDPSFTSLSKRDWVQYGQPEAGSVTTGKLQSPVARSFPTNPDEHAFWY